MKRIQMLFRFLLIASSFYYSDAKKMHRSRVRQAWDFQCAKGESISGLTAQHVIDDLVATFTCESLGDSSGSPAIQEGACRETKEFQVLKDGKLVPGGGESGCKSDEYVAGVKSSVSGKTTNFQRKLKFKCCKAKNADTVKSGCHTVGPMHPFHFKKGEIMNLMNKAKPGPSCPKYGLNTFLVDQTGFTLQYCPWKVKGAKYPETCSKESPDLAANEDSEGKALDEVASKKGNEKLRNQDSETLKAKGPGEKSKPPSAAPESPSSAESRGKNSRAQTEVKHSGVSGRTEAAEPATGTTVTIQASATESATKKPHAASVTRSERISHTQPATTQAITQKPKHSSRSGTATASSAASSKSPTKPKATHTEAPLLTADELAEVVADPNLKSEIEGEVPKASKSDANQPKQPHVPALPPKQEKITVPPVVISESIDAADEPSIHVHEETIEIPKDTVTTKAAAQSAVSTSGLLKCKPGSVGNQKWSCFAGEHCNTDAGCATKCNNWKPGLDFGAVATTKCVAGNGDEQYCCCTYEGQGQTDCPAANDRRGTVRGGQLLKLAAKRNKN